MDAPLVSIVTATYNRSNVLRLTLDALCASTFTDWELIVVGDACTDDTADVVASFGDARMRFVNLARNSGDQAVPNNAGVRLARGEYIAFLNHDDLWIPEHLESALDAIGDADLVSTLTITIDAQGVPHLRGVCPRGVYEPQVIVPASSWLLRRSVAERVGPWRPANEIFASPSQEWLFRAWKQKRRLIALPRATVLAVLSGGRKDSYAKRLLEENARYAALLREDPELMTRLVTEVAVRLSTELKKPSSAAIQLTKDLFRRASIALGAHPLSLYHALRYPGRGGFIASLRRTRGLPPAHLGERTR